MFGIGTYGTETGAAAVKGELANATTGAFLREDQQNYAVGRLEQLTQAQMDAEVTKNPYPFDHRPSLTIDEMFVMVRDGKAKPIDLGKKNKACQLPSGERTQWTQMWTFPPTEDQKAYDAVTARLDAFEKALGDKRDAAVDQIMLGTNSSAKDILDKFGPGAPDPTKAGK